MKHRTTRLLLAASAAALLLPAPLAAQSNTDPPPFLRTGPSLTQPPAVCPDFVKTRWMDRDGDGWDDLWVYMNRIAHRDHTTDTDGDTVSDYDEMLRWRDPNVKGPPLGWPFLTVEEILQAEIATEALRRQNEARMAQRRIELRRFAAGLIGKGTRGPRAVRSLGDARRAREDQVRQKWQAGAGKRQADLEKARAFLRAKGIPEVIKGRDGKAMIFSGADKNGKPRYYITHNLTAAKSIAVDALTLPVINGGPGLTGMGVIVGHWDGADALFTHQDLGTTRVADSDTTSGDLNGILASRIHATHTAGTILGLGLNGVIDSYAAGAAKGMATGATLKSWDSADDLSEMTNHYINTAPAERVLISNHSYGSPVGWDGEIDGIPVWNRSVDSLFEGVPQWDSFIRFGEYTSTSNEVDEHVFDSLYHLPVYSAGNHRNQYSSPPPTEQFYLRDAFGMKLYTRTRIIPPSGTAYYLWRAADGSQWGSLDDPPPAPDGANTGGFRTIGPEVTAHNVLSVGSCADLPGGYAGPGSVLVSAFSSRCPTVHGLIKPDVVANGESLLSAVYDAGSNHEYGASTGTSMAAPSVVGGLALLTEHYRGKYGPAAKLWSSTLKALVIHTADQVDSDGDPATYYDGPDHKGTGWGKANFERAASLIALDGVPGPQGGPRHALVREIWANILEGPEIEIPVTATGGEPVIVTWTWPDPPNPEFGAGLDNGFLIEVIDAAGNRYFEWMLDPANPAAPAVQRERESEDPFEAVHQILIPAPVAGGTYTVRINGCCYSEVNHNYSDYAPGSVIMSGVEASVPELKITHVERVSSTGVVSLGWQSNPGEIYRIETSTDLVTWTRAKDPENNDVPDLLPQGMFSTAEVNEEVSGETRRFWRVRALHPWEE